MSITSCAFFATNKGHNIIKIAHNIFKKLILNWECVSMKIQKEHRKGPFGSVPGYQ